jgi:hypothetical protein
VPGVKDAGSGLMQCCICGNVTIFPVEYIVNGIALGLFMGLKGGMAGPRGGAGTASEPRMLPIPGPLMILPSAGKIWPSSNPGVFVGTPLTSRQEIWSSVTEFCDGASGVGATGWFWASAPREEGRACGSCFGDTASEGGVGRVGCGAGDCGNAKFSKTGRDAPRLSRGGLGAGRVASLAGARLRQRSGSWADGVVCCFSTAGACRAIAGGCATSTGARIRVMFCCWLLEASAGVPGCCGISTSFWAVSHLFLTGFDEMNWSSSSAADLLVGTVFSLVPTLLGGTAPFGGTGSSSLEGEDMLSKTQGLWKFRVMAVSMQGKVTQDRSNVRLYLGLSKAKPSPLVCTRDLARRGSERGETHVLAALLLHHAGAHDASLPWKGHLGGLCT